MVDCRKMCAYLPKPGEVSIKPSSKLEEQPQQQRKLHLKIDLCFLWVYEGFGATCFVEWNGQTFWCVTEPRAVRVHAPPNPAESVEKHAQRQGLYPLRGMPGSSSIRTIWRRPNEHGFGLRFSVKEV